MPGFCLTRSGRVLSVSQQPREEVSDSEAHFGEEISKREREEGIKALAKKITTENKSLPIGQIATRYQVVLAFLKLQRSRQPSETREEGTL